MGNLCATDAPASARDAGKPEAGSTAKRHESDHVGFRSGLVRRKAGSDIWKFYEQGRQIGKGMTGGVWVIKHKHTGQEYAMKSIILNRMKQELLDDLRNEIELLKMLDHPNIIKLYEYYEDQYRIYLVLELCTGGELYERLADQKSRHYTEKEAARLVSKMLSAICYCHRKQISHRDLKLENFIFESEEEDANIKLIDFGLSRKYAEMLRMNTMVGTPYYIAPEILRGHGYTQAVDMWSMGVITYMLLSGKPPFAAREDSAILAKVRKAKFTFTGPAWKVVSADAQDFVSRLLEPNPRKRITAEMALQHRWLKRNYDFDAAVAPGGSVLDASILSSLRDFTRMTSMKRAALETIAFSLNAREIVELRRAFQRIDKDHSGQIFVGELKEALIMEGMSEEEVKGIFDGVNQDHSETISYSEFLAATLSKRLYMQEERIQEAFHRLDVDNTGYITPENLRAVMGDDYAPERVARFMAEADTAGDGRIDYAEFCRMVRDEGVSMVEAVKPDGPPSADKGPSVFDSMATVEEGPSSTPDGSDEGGVVMGGAGGSGGDGGEGGDGSSGDAEAKAASDDPRLAASESVATVSAVHADASSGGGGGGGGGAASGAGGGAGAGTAAAAAAAGGGDKVDSTTPGDAAT